MINSDTIDTKKESTSTAKVYIIILNWNGLNDTLECLRSVYRLDYPDFEVIVVDNASSDNSPEVILANFPRIFLMKNSENLGYAGGNNRAMRYAMEQGADYLWLLNNDTVVEPDTLSKIVATAEGAPDIGMISPVVYFYHEPDKIQFAGCYIDHKIFVEYPEPDLNNTPDESVSGKSVWLWGTALLVKRKVVEKIGYFNEEFFAYWEDTDYSLRVLENNFSNVVDLTAKIYHKTLLPQQGIKRRGSHFYYYVARNKLFLGAKHTKGFQRIFFVCHYLADTIFLINHFSHQANSDHAIDAYLTGVSDAFLNRSGQWNGIVKAPVWLKKIYGLLCSWHPFFWMDLLRGEFAKISLELLRRIKTKLTRSAG
jgi:GT2 family glycosyltransferase